MPGDSDDTSSQLKSLVRPALMEASGGRGGGGRRIPRDFRGPLSATATTTTAAKDGQKVNTLRPVVKRMMRQ